MSGACIPLPTTFIPVITPGSSSTTQQNVTVNITNQLQVTDTGIAQVSDAVKQGISDGIDEAVQVAKQAADAVTKGVGDVVDSINTAASGLLDNLWNTLKSIGGWIQTHLTTVVGDIVSGLKKGLGDVVSALGTAVASLPDTISAITAEVKDINDNLIQPISTAISTTITTISTLTQAIEQDLKDGLSGILQIPSDVAGAMTTLDATMQRTVEQLGCDNTDLVTTTIGGTKDDTLWTRLHALNGTLSQPTGAGHLAAVWSDKVNLNDPGIQQITQALLASINKDAKGLIGALEGGIDNLWKELNSKWQDGAGFTGAIAGGILWVAMYAGLIATEVYPVAEAVIEQARSNTRLSKLDAATTIQAEQRGYIDPDKATQELAYEGFDAGRQQVLRDLAKYRPTNQELLDWWHRGLLADNDKFIAFDRNGVDADQEKLLEDASYKLVDIQRALESYRYGDIDANVLKDVMTKLRWTDDEQAMFFSVIEKHESVEDVVTRGRIEDLYQNLKFSPAEFSTVPPGILDAAKRDGLDAQIALDIWQRSFWVPPLEMYVNLYFRGVRTLTELQAVMTYYRVPSELQKDIITARQALIPYRTIPTMLAKGIISESYAKQQLGAHGFDLAAQEAILAYAKTVHATSTSAASGNVHAQSIANAKAYWDLGAITDSEYEQVLTDHGYTADMAAAVVHTEAIALAAKERKQIAQDLVDEFTAGLITLDQVNTQMAAQDFTIVEKARVSKMIARQAKQLAKMPSESELHSMAEHGAITIDMYSQALTLLGYAKNWVDAFTMWRFPSESKTASTA